MKHGNRLKDMTGQRFGLLTVLEYAYTKNKHAYWQVKCDCGTIKAVGGSELRRRTIKSCGCNRGKEVIGLPQSVKINRTYHIWHQMKQRCFNPKTPRYSSYGGRGVTICKRWLKYENFLADMGEAPTNKSIDRIRNNGNYKPDNCQWATSKQQQNNTRSNFNIEYQGITKTLTEWAKHLNINKATLSKRIHRSGWSIEKAFTTKV